MPRNSLGVYTLPAGNPVVTNTPISSAGWGNPTMSDIGSELTNSLDRSGRGGMTAPLLGTDGLINLPAFSFTSEPTSGLWRKSAGVLSMSIAAAEAIEFVAQGLAAPLGLVGTPPYSFMGDLNTGMWSPGADTLAWSTTGVERMRFDAAGMGGIGNTPPAWSGVGFALTVGAAGAAALLGTAGVGRFTTNMFFNGANWIHTTTAESEMYLQTAAAHIWYGDASGAAGSTFTPTERMRLSNTGQLGINVTPNAQFHVKGSGLLAKVETTTARGGGQNYIDFFDPSGGSAEIGFGTSVSDFYVTNILNGNLFLSTNNAARFTVTADGRLYGSAIHNSAGSVSGTVNGYIASGTYIPTCSAVSNCSCVGTQATWIRVGNVVTVSGVCFCDPITAGTFTEFGVSLPIASTFVTGVELAGVCSRDGAVVSLSAPVSVNLAAPNRAEITFICDANATNRAWLFTFTYTVT